MFFQFTFTVKAEPGDAQEETPWSATNSHRWTFCAWSQGGQSGGSGPRPSTPTPTASAANRYNEDPVTGSANAGLAQWLLAEGVTDGNYTARQRTVLGRGGIIELSNESGSIWVGGSSRSVIKGSVSF